MSDEFAIHNWELERLIYEQSTLVGKATPLTPEEKQLFRTRSKNRSIAEQHGGQVFCKQATTVSRSLCQLGLPELS